VALQAALIPSLIDFWLTVFPTIHRTRERRNGIAPGEADGGSPGTVRSPVDPPMVDSAGMVSASGELSKHLVKSRRA
jgi:hypothetical protein